jgi:predicted NUDIX family NTP pyrophosphohydrolase
MELGSFKQPGGKIISAWALEGDFDIGTLRSNTFSIEWPPRSGRMETFPEVDRAEWFTPPVARKKLLGEAAKRCSKSVPVRAMRRPSFTLIWDEHGR